MSGEREKLLEEMVDILKAERDEARRWAAFFYGAVRATVPPTPEEPRATLARDFAAVLERWEGR